MKSVILSAALILFLGTSAHAQTDTIFVKGNEQILCTNIKKTSDQYSFKYLNTENVKVKSSILKYLVDSVKYYLPVVDSNGIVNKKKKIKVVDTLATTVQQPKENPWRFTAAIGVNLGSILEFNNPTSTDKKTLSLNTSLDLGLNYRKPDRRFEMTNELHYLFGIQKEGLSSGTHLQRVQDDLATLHDISFGLRKKNTWNFNIIVRASTSVFEIFDGDYFKDFTALGRIKGFASPYDVTVSPGIKYQPSQSFRVSQSPYSFRLSGVKNREIANKGIFISDLDASGNYKNFLYKRLGAEVNFWFDKRVKEWLDMQYRLSFSSDYFEKFGKNGLMDGLFITRVKIIKDIYLTHRLSLSSDVAGNFWKPHFNQNIMLSYTKSF